jgi:16S rRNA processing protein RimM
LLVAFTGITDRTKAAELGNTWLSVDSSELPPTNDPDEFRDHELIGLEVRTVTNQAVGVVKDVLHHGQDILVIGPSKPGQPSSTSKPSTAGTEHLVPFVKALVPEVDLANGVLIIDPPPGLLDPDEAQ